MTEFAPLWCIYHQLIPGGPTALPRHCCAIWSEFGGKFLSPKYSLALKFSLPTEWLALFFPYCILTGTILQLRSSICYNLLFVRAQALTAETISVVPLRRVCSCLCLRRPTSFQAGRVQLCRCTNELATSRGPFHAANIRHQSHGRIMLRLCQSRH